MLPIVALLDSSVWRIEKDLPNDYEYFDISTVSYSIWSFDNLSFCTPPMAIRYLNKATSPIPEHNIHFLY